MSSRYTRILEKRAQLIAQSDMQRKLIGQCMVPWRKPLHYADQGIEVLRYLKQHPAWIVGTGMMLIALRPARTLKWLKLSWAAWILVRKLRH